MPLLRTNCAPRCELRSRTHTPSVSTGSAWQSVSGSAADIFARSTTPVGRAAFSFSHIGPKPWQLPAEGDRRRSMKTSKSLKSLVGLASSAVLAAAACCSPTVPDRPDDVCENIAVGDLVVTEFLADPVGSDTGKQFIEVYNATDHTLDLGGLQLYQSLADGSRLKAIALHSGNITPHAYFVLGDTGDAVDARPGYVNYGYGSALGALRHDNGTIGLRCGSTVITETTYTQVTAGHARALDGPHSANATAGSDESYWCDATEPLSSLAPEGENFGSPGTANPACPRADSLPADLTNPASHVGSSGGAPPDVTDSGVIAGQCFDAPLGARRNLNKLHAGDLLVSEIMPAPSNGNNGPGEWFEALVMRDVDLNGLELANEGTGSTVLTSDTCMSVKAGAWLLFARSNDPTQNGGLPSPVAAIDFTLADSGSSTYPERTLVLRLEGGEIDRAVWTKSTKGASWQRAPSSLGSPGTATSSDWCTSPADHTFGTGDRGTPGAANAGCASDIADGGSILSSESGEVSIGGAPATLSTGSSKPVVSGGATSGGAPAHPNTGTSNPSSSGGATSGGAPASSNTAATELGGSGGASSGGAPTTGGTSSRQQCRDVTEVIRDPVAPQTGDLVITEIMSAPSQNNNGTGEWLEVLVNVDLDLNGLELANEGTGSTLLESDGCLRVQSGERLLFARSAVAADNGGLPFVTALFDFTVADSSSTAHLERAIVLRHAGTEISRATWTKSTKGAAWQLSAGAPDAGDSDSDAGSSVQRWCTTPIGVTFGAGDRGTPGAENAACP